MARPIIPAATPGTHPFSACAGDATEMASVAMAASASSDYAFGAPTWSDGEAVFHVGAGLRRSDDKRDYFAPTDWKTLDARDADLGGSNPLPLDIPGAGDGRALILALGKDGK